MSGPDIDQAAAAGLVPQEWSPGGNRCQKPTNGRTERCWNRARWCDEQAGARYDRYVIGAKPEPGSYAYKVCDRHARLMVAANDLPVGAALGEPRTDQERQDEADSR